MASGEQQANMIELAAELTAAWLGNGNTRVDQADVPAFLEQIYRTLSELGKAPEPVAVEQPSMQIVPAVSVRKSLASPDYILSMIDGKPYKSLKRHLTTHGMTPDEYRQRFGLKADYPMVAPNYAEMRRAMAYKIGLGAKGRAAKKAAASAKGRKPQKKVV